MTSKMSPIRPAMDKNSPNWCEVCRYEHGPLYICESYSKERKAKIKKSIPRPPKKILFQISSGYAVWMSKDKQQMVIWTQGLFMGGYHAFKRIGDTDRYENINYGTIYITANGAKKALQAKEA